MAYRSVFSVFFFVVAAVFIFSGCALQRPATDPSLDKKAFFLATRARSANQHIVAGKGSGWIWIETESRVDKFKIAWAAKSPHKIRITFLISGLPVETIVATGKKVTFFSHTGDHSTYTDHSVDPDMQDYIQVPVKMSEIISILLGRLPVNRFDDAYFSPSDPSLSTIILTQDRKKTVRHLHLNDQGKVDGLTLTGSNGSLVYTLAITKYTTYDFGDVPVQIEIQDKNRKKLTLRITNFQPNPAIKDAVFWLTDPG